MLTRDLRLARILCGTYIPLYVAPPPCALSGQSPLDLTWRRRFEEAPAGANPTTQERKKRSKRQKTTKNKERCKETQTNAAQKGQRRRDTKGERSEGQPQPSQGGWEKKRVAETDELKDRRRLQRQRRGQEGTQSTRRPQRRGGETKE